MAHTNRSAPTSRSTNRARRSLGIAAVALLGAASLAACSGDIDLTFDTGSEEGSGTITTETHQVSGFGGVSLCCGLDVEIEFEESSTQSVDITLDENLHRFLEVDVNGDVLRIKPQNDVDLDPTALMIVTISGPALTSLDVEAGSNVVVDWPSVERLFVDADAGADVTLTVDVDELEVHADAGSDVTLEGRADQVIADADAAADIRLTAVEIADASVDADAGSTIEIEATGTITGSADAGSDIDIWGQPSRVDIDADISSDVNYKN